MICTIMTKGITIKTDAAQINTQVQKSLIFTPASW